MQPRRRRLLLAGSVAVVTTVTAVATQLAFASASLHDTFEDGDSAGWSKSGGTWSVVDEGDVTYT